MNNYLEFEKEIQSLEKELKIIMVFGVGEEGEESELRVKERNKSY